MTTATPQSVTQRVRCPICGGDFLSVTLEDVLTAWEKREKQFFQVLYHKRCYEERVINEGR